MPKWTNEQQQVIDLRGKSMLVAAAAGSGKTAVLVERIIQMISDETNPVDIDSLLVVTFTNAAAAEMKERIGAAIQNQLRENPMSEHLYRQSLLLQKAQITTLHSFCLDLVRQNFFRLGIDPNRKIADETENQLLLGETLDEVLEYHYSEAEDTEAFIALVDQYGGREDEQLRDVLLRLYRMAQSMAQPETWLSQVGSDINVDWFASAEQDIIRQLRHAQKQMIRAVRIAEAETGLDSYVPHMEQEYNWISELIAVFLYGTEDDEAKDKWELCSEKLITGGFQRLPSVKKNTCDEDAKKQVTDYRDSAKKIIAKVREEYFTRTKEQLQQELEAQQPIRHMLCTLTLELMKAFQTKKADKNLMDFHDMEHFCCNLLYEQAEDGATTYSDLAQQLKAQYTEILVDEYQDINDLQESILQAVSRENNLFMVGDIKQSIYGFRMANPNLFARKYQQFSSDVDSEADCVRIDLNRNFRCRTNVVDGVNEVFAQIMTGQNNDLVYDANAALVYGADYPDVVEGSVPIPEQVQLIVITAPEEQAEGEESPTVSMSSAAEEQPLSTMEEEGALICREIKKLMQEPAQVYDKRLQGYRNITWRDVVVLLRAPKAAGTVYARMMKEAGIPAAVDTGDGYFTAWEIQIVTSLLHIIDNPLQDIPLLAVMKAPFFGFNEEELAQLRLLKAKTQFYHCVALAAETEDAAISESLREKTNAFLQQLQYWRRIAQQMDLSQLIWQLYKDTGFYEYVGALRDGVQRQANLRALHERARAYEQTSFKGVFMFLRFLEQLQDNQADLEPAKVLGDNDNVVRIISIHKSKGLEFPVVFVGGMGRKFNNRDTQQDFLLDKDYGLAFSAVDGQLEIRYKTIAQRVVAQKKRMELLQEEKRVLYVAMTRARERLYLIGSCDKPENKKDIGAEQAGCYLDWFLPLELKAPLWNVQYLPTGTVVDHTSSAETDGEPTLRQMIQQEIPLPPPSEHYAQIDAQLSWQYDNPAFTKIKAQSSVTELKQRFNTDTAYTELNFNFDGRPDAVRKKEGLTSAEKGTLLHFIVSHVDLQEDITIEYLKQLAARLEAEQYIDSGASEAISLDGIYAFFQSSLGKRMLSANPAQRYTELPFITALDSHYIDETLPQGEKNILVQGIIDCLWQEDGGWVLIDYKSDHVNKNQTNLILERYSGQMNLYRHAVEQILGEPVKEAYFYLLSVGISVEA